MAVNVNFNEQIKHEIGLQLDTLSATLKGFKWAINRENLGTFDVQNRIHTATAYTLSSLAEQMDNTDPTEELMKKISDAKDIIEALSDPNKPDPRLWTLVNCKIPKLTFNSLHRDQKISRCSELLKKFADSDPSVEHRDIVRAQMQLMRASLTDDNRPRLRSSSECPSPMTSLQLATFDLSRHSAEGFSMALDALLQLDGLTFCPYVQKEEEQITSRIFFHIQDIHKKETPENVIHHGSDAFLSPKMSAEKLRAVQRTQAEVSIFALKEFLEGDLSIDSPLAGKSTIAGIFDILENLKLDPKDYKGNLAHALFGTLYNNYLAAWKQNQSMVHPHDPIFKDDFGRNAFVGESKDRISNAYKIQALNEISQSLKDAWS